MLLVLSLYMPLLIKVNGKITCAQIFVGYLGLFLFGAAALAIGMFASARSRTHQLVALAASARSLLLMVLGNVFQLAKQARSRRCATCCEQLDLWWVHFQSGFMRGILNLKDVIYYVASIYFFLLLAVKTLEAKRWQ